MREYVGTAGLIASIFVVVALMFMAPKGFSLADPQPIVAASPELATE